MVFSIPLSTLIKIRSSRFAKEAMAGLSAWDKLFCGTIFLSNGIFSISLLTILMKVSMVSCFLFDFQFYLISNYEYFSTD